MISWFVYGALFTLFFSWVVGNDVDVDEVNPRACLEACRLTNGIPKWAQKEMVFKRVDVTFYDYTHLDPDEWRRLRGAISDFFGQVKAEIVDSPTVNSKDLDDIIFELAKLGVCNVHEFKASVSTLLLMVVHPTIYNDMDRFKRYEETVQTMVDRYTRVTCVS